MAKKSMGVLLLAFSVVLLVVVSLRVAPDAATDSQSAVPTDDPYPEESEPPEFLTQPSADLMESEVNIRELLPDVSIGDWSLKLVNNNYVLPSTFAPDVTSIGNGQYFDSRAVGALQSMIAAAEEAGYSVYVSTAYRPYSTQAYIFFGKASQIAWGGEVEYADAEMLARETVAYPGTSEHQLGLCADLMDSADTRMAAEDVENLPVLKWLTEHCAEYGFILRYPKDKQEITGWYEPWHFRYVGQSAAQYIMENDLCLEEFIALF